MATPKTIPAQEFQKQFEQEKGIIIDVRTPSEFEAGHLEGALNSDYLGGQFAQEIDQLDKNQTYYLYCKSGGRSGRSAELLAQAGFEKAYNIGGFEDLKNSGLPVEY